MQISKSLTGIQRSGDVNGGGPPTGQPMQPCGSTRLRKTPSEHGVAGARDASLQSAAPLSNQQR